MIQQLEQLLLDLAEKIPVELFVLIGAFIEEVISPIPSAVVLITSGGILNVQNGIVGISVILFLGLLATVSKLLGSLLLYFIADKFENIVVDKLGKFFDISKNDIENLGAKLKGNWWDYLLLSFMYSMPIFPSGPISLMAGFFKVPYKVFIIGNVIGTYLKSCLYLYIGFTGAEFYNQWSEGIATAETFVQFLIVLFLVILILWFKLKKKKKF